jgi:indole-3-glycerol phosphate synthase
LAPEDIPKHNLPEERPNARMLLDSILAVTRTRVAALHVRAGELRRQAENAAPPLAFLAVTSTVGIIAEIKRRSPSQGSIRPDLDPVAHAQAYARGGAVAISVLTDEVHFGGSLEDLTRVAGAVRIPVLRKDFIIDELQLLEALAAGASAVLLIARILTPAQLTSLRRAAGALGLGTLVEVHEERELEGALAVDPTAIGINARDLDTFKVDWANAERVIARLPGNVITVAESGIESRQDVERAATAGADFALVGTSVARQPDPEQAVRTLAGVQRRERKR